MQHQIIALPQHGAAFRHNLPTPLTPLIGREQEVASASALLKRPEVRLLTLSGTGGVGKTRLGLQVATELMAEFSDGVFFVPLAPISDPALVIPTIAQTLQVREVGGDSLLDLLKVFLAEKQLLLLLDNFEQILTAAPQLTNLLLSCPDLKLLVTSRAVLHVQGEHEFPVPPLALPDLKRLPDPVVLSHYAAVVLFVSRTQAFKPDFTLTAVNAKVIADICVRLDGLPLAIELAAARVKILSPQALLARLEHRLQVLTSGLQDAPTRQQTLRNTIAWSYDLLTPQEQRLFRRLSIFVGGCTLEAIEDLCTTLDGEAEGVLDGIASLLDKSLLLQSEQETEEPRFVMLETIREYGLEALAAGGERATARQAHAIYYLALAEKIALEWNGPRQEQGFVQLEQMHDNLRRALQWLRERKEAELVLRLSNALEWFWLNRQHLSESRYWLELALSESEGVEGVASIRALALQALALLLVNQGDFEQAERRCEESAALYRELGNTVSMHWPLQILAIVKHAQGEYTRARTLLEECLACFNEADDKVSCAYSLCHLAELVGEQGEYDKACSYAQESLTLFKESEDTGGSEYALLHLAQALFLSQGSKPAVRALLEECLALSKGGSFQNPTIQALLAEFTLCQGDMVTARSLIEESLAILRTEGYQSDVPEKLIVGGRVIAAQGDYVKAQALYEESLALAREFGYKRLIPTSLEGLANVVAAQGELTWALRLWAAAETLRTEMGTYIPPVYRPNYEHAVAAARAQLGEQEFSAAWAEGRAMTLEQVLFAQEPVQPTAPLPEPSSPTYPDRLTSREVEVLRLVAQGLSNTEIAEQLIISLLTVKAHMRSLYNKLGISSRSAATRYAIEHQLI